jgi:hypothetical protein
MVTKPRAPEFDWQDRRKIAGRGIVHYGPFPFVDSPSRDSKDVIGRVVQMDGELYSIRAIERHLVTRPYEFGEPVGLMLTRFTPAQVD